VFGVDVLIAVIRANAVNEKNRRAAFRSRGKVFEPPQLELPAVGRLEGLDPSIGKT
jgi:hypothetical protein